MRKDGKIGMIKGCAKRVVVVKDVDSSLFEEAFFIVRAGMPNKHLTEEDYMTEAAGLVRSGNSILPPCPTKVITGKGNSSGFSENPPVLPNVRQNKKAAVRKSSVLRDFLMFLLGFVLSGSIFGFIL